MDYVIPEIIPSEYKSIPTVSMIGKLPINPRVGNWDKMNGLRNINDINTVMLHHCGTNKAKIQSYSDEYYMQVIAKNQINSTKNVPTGDNFPYHIFIRRGTIYFTNPILFYTFGSGKSNKYSVQIAVAGDYANHDVLTDNDRKALHLAILIVKSTMTSFKRIQGHNEVSATSCPGYSVPQIINEINALEHHIEVMKTPQDKFERAYRIANQILYLYNMGSKGLNSIGEPATEGERMWAIEQVLKLEVEMKKHNLLK